jgi:hypothetical protein
MDKLINTNGQINFHGYDLRNNMDNPITGLRKKMGVNQFQFIGFTGDDLILGFAIVSLKWISNQPNNGQWSFNSGKNHVSISSGKGLRRLKLNVGTDFNLDRNERFNSWNINTSDGHINLRFEPEGERKEKVNAGFIASNFTQLLGRFYDTIKGSR